MHLVPILIAHDIQPMARKVAQHEMIVDTGLFFRYGLQEGDRGRLPVLGR